LHGARLARRARRGGRVDRDPAGYAAAMSAASSPTAFADLDNPFWSSLRSRHADLAQVVGETARYPASHAPFLGVAHADVDTGAAFARLVAPGESLYLLGVAPRAPAGWRLEPLGELAQMVRTAPIPLEDGPDLVALDDTHRADVLALTARVYPHYFRERTMAMGRYFGVYVEGRLAAMVGERLGTERFREVSAICTHPDFTGRGYARRLTAWLCNDLLAAGLVPFLHVSHGNPRAKALYERMGFRLRRDIPFWSLRRADD